MFEFSHPTSADVPAIVELWNAAFGPDFPLTEQLLRQTMNGDPFYEADGCWLARDGATLAGWVLSKSMKDAGAELGRFAGRGGIGALCVHPAYQRRGLGTQLLERVAKYLQENHSPVTLLYYPHHLLPGVPVEQTAARTLFEKHGFKKWRECVDLRRDLSSYEMPASARAALARNPTVEIRPAREDERELLLEFVAHEFPGGWLYSTKNHFVRGGRAADFIVAVENSALIGFCHTVDFRSPWLLASAYWFPLMGEYYGGFGPVGIAAAHRKRGLGLAICAVATDDLKKRGVQCAAIDWTTLVDFYGKLGFTVWKRYLQAEREF